MTKNKLIYDELLQRNNILEQELSTSRDKSHTQSLLLEKIDNAVITIDFDNIILSWNKHAGELYQWTKARR